MELFIEDQTFSPSHDWVLLPPPVSKLSLFLSIHVSMVELTDGEKGPGGRGGGGANLYDREKTRSSINHSILSGQPVRCMQCLQRCKMHE